MVLRPTPVKFLIPESMQKRHHPYQHLKHGQKIQQHLTGKLSNVWTTPVSKFDLERGNASHIKAKDGVESAIASQKWRFAMPMPGFSLKDIQISLHPGHVRVEGRSNFGEGEDKRPYCLCRTISLPQTVDVQKLSTSLSNSGILTVEVPYKTEHILKSLSGYANKLINSLESEISKSMRSKESESMTKKHNTHTEHSRQETEVSDEEKEVDIGDIPSLLRKRDDKKDTARDKTQESQSSYDHKQEVKEDSNNEPKAQQPQNFYRVSVNLSNFSPENIFLSLEDKCLVIRAENKAEGTPGFGDRLVRRYFLPPNVDTSAVRCHRSTAGVMTLLAPYKVS